MKVMRSTVNMFFSVVQEETNAQEQDKTNWSNWYGLF